MHKIILNILIEISKDGLRAYMTLLDDNIQYDVDKAIEEIKEFLVVGLNIDKVKEVINNKIINQKTLIAEGIPPADGIDGYIKYNFEINKKRVPRVLDNGNVDYRELDVINNVTAGEILAEIIPPREGTDGKKVTGENIPYKRGKIPRLNYGKNVRLLNNNRTLIAEKNGFVTFINNKLIVLDVYEVENVDNSVGNIYFDGTVVVKKNVLNGFKVKADGDVQINGILEGGYIENTGDVIVKHGIQGCNKLVVKSKGNVTSKFIENATIVSDKDVNAEVIMHSKVSCKGNVNLIGRRGLIVGGSVRSGKEISAKTVGSVMSTTTVLEVGIDPEIKDKFENIKKQIKIKKEELNKINKAIILLEKLKKVNKLDHKKMLMYGKIKKTKETLLKELDTLNHEYDLLKMEMENVTNGMVKISNVVYPGVKIVIGSSSTIVREKMKSCIFYLDEGEVRVRSYWE